MKKERKQKILDTARKMIAEQGHACFNMKELATLSGVPRASLYRAYASKEHVISELTLVWGLSLVDRLQQQNHRGRTNGARIRGVFRSVLQEAQSEPQLIQAVLESLLSGDKKTRMMQIEIEELLPALLSSAVDYQSIPDFSSVLDILLRLLLAELQMLSSGRNDLNTSLAHLTYTAEKLMGEQFWTS